MRILFVAPFPPPITGNSLPIKVLYDSLQHFHEIDRIDLSKKNHKGGVDSFARILDVILILFKFYFKIRKTDLVYLSISESKAGNIRDLLFYLLSFRKLDKVYLHMLGGAGMSKILTSRKISYSLNKYFISRVAGVIVEGEVQKGIFSSVIDPLKIKIVPNFAQDHLFLNEIELSNKFIEFSKIKILFLSNMLPGKGHQELLKAYIELNPIVQNSIRIDFAGKIVEEKWGEEFLAQIDKFPNLFYHGSVDFNAKIKLFKSAHIFCLPTYYRYEGQPFTIIEAYASGNVVITTKHSGIPNIFNVKNGYQVEPRSVDNLKELLTGLSKLKPRFEEIAKHNLRYAQNNFTQSKFLENVRSFLQI
jgi:glycosyltransferase involved in cell wall biosynthesis